MTRYTYDALNRITEIELDSLDTITFQYDTGSNAIGRLNKITDASGETTWMHSNTDWFHTPMVRSKYYSCRLTFCDL